MVSAIKMTVEYIFNPGKNKTSTKKYNRFCFNYS